MNRKKRLVIGIIGVAAVLVVLGTTVAYFVTDIEDTNKEVLTVNTGTLSLIFDDNSDGVNTSLLVGESVTKELKIHNNGTLPVTTNLNWYDLTNTYLPNSLSYKLEFKDSEAGTYQVIEAEQASIPKSLKASEATILKNITIGPEETYYYKITITLESLENMNQENDRDAGLATRFSLGDYKEIKVNFTEPATTDEGLYAMEDDYGTSYYYRGAVENNYVKFGEYYWRIIRFNGDGSMRMIYDGTRYHENGEASEDRVAFYSQWSSVYNDAKYVGYMYGGAKGVASTSKEQAQTNETDSDIKIALDNWYKKNLEEKGFSKYISDSIFCNDRTLAEKNFENLVFGPYNQLGYGKNFSVYQGRAEVVSSNNEDIKLICPEKNDAFTRDDTIKGNGALTYPVGLITEKEFLLGGAGKFISEHEPQNSKFYLYKGVWQWLFTPSYFGSPERGMAFGNSYLNYWNYGNDHVYKSNGVAPVINLKAEYVQKLIGTGVKDDEYRLPDVN